MKSIMLHVEILIVSKSTMQSGYSLRNQFFIIISYIKLKKLFFIDLSELLITKIFNFKLLFQNLHIIFLSIFCKLLKIAKIINLL
jgi:hypothetical protein